MLLTYYFHQLLRRLAVSILAWLTRRSSQHCYCALTLPTAREFGRSVRTRTCTAISLEMTWYCRRGRPLTHVARTPQANAALALAEQGEDAELETLKLATSAGACSFVFWFEL